MKFYCGYRRRYGMFRAVVFHWSGMREEEIYDYYGSYGYSYATQALSAAKKWADEQGIEVEMES